MAIQTMVVEIFLLKLKMSHSGASGEVRASSSGEHECLCWISWQYIKINC